MRYIGGKARTARRIVDVILAQRSERTAYIEPFLGAASVAALAVPHFETATLADSHPDIPVLWRAIARGWEPPEWIDRETYDTLRRQPVASPLRAWAGFAASYNGKYFGGYGPEAKSAGRNYLDEARRAALKKAPGLAGATIIEADYRDFSPNFNTVVYSDPPYAGTLGYGGTEPFDSTAFWRTMTQWSSQGALVLVSEYEAPLGWVSVFDVERTATVHHASSPPTRTEGLFVFRGEDITADDAWRSARH